MKNEVSNLFNKKEKKILLESFIQVLLEENFQQIIKKYETCDYYFKSQIWMENFGDTEIEGCRLAQSLRI
jgi:hypothetical protein